MPTIVSQRCDTIDGISVYQQGCRNRVRIPTYVNLDKQSSPCSSSALQPQSDAMGLGTILESFHTKRREFRYMCGEVPKAGDSYARVYLYVLTIEPSHTLLLIDRNANYGITTGNHQKYEKPYGNHFVWTGRGW
jgi:hypothetical protein